MSRRFLAGVARPAWGAYATGPKRLRPLCGVRVPPAHLARPGGHKPQMAAPVGPCRDGSHRDRGLDHQTAHWSARTVGMRWTVQFDRHTRLGRLLLPAILVAIPLQPARAAVSPKELLETGYADEAIQSLEQKISHSPDDAESFNLLCRAYFMIDEWDRGIKACERANKLDPQKSLYHLWLGRIYGEKADRAGFLSAAGLAKKVRNSFERAVELDPRSWEARTDLAEFYLQAPAIVGGGQDKARAQADALLPINPAMAHWVLARIAAKNKDFAGAEREYRAAIEASHGLDPWLPSSLNDAAARAVLDFVPRGALILEHAQIVKDRAVGKHDVLLMPVQVAV